MVERPSSVEKATVPSSKTPSSARAATLAQIARHVGVSKVAVSVVLNKTRTQTRVSPETRQKILDAAQELNYQPNVVARSLMRRRTNIIGFYSVQRQIADPSYPFYGSILKGLLKGCEIHQKNFLLHGTCNGMSEEDVYLELLNGQIDGLILYAREPTALTERLVASRLPVVTVADKVPGLPCVTVDERMGGHLLVTYLAQKGYKTVLYLVDHEELPSTIRLRLASFLDEAKLQGLQVEVFHPRNGWPYDKDLEQIMARQDRPEVIAAFSDFMAHYVIQWCNKNGVRVPQDVAVTGFDGSVGAFGGPTDFTTIDAAWDVVAQNAFTLLVQQCEGETVPMEMELPVTLIVGTTA